jgi:hypothetical protein
VSEGARTKAAGSKGGAAAARAACEVQDPGRHCESRHLAVEVGPAEEDFRVQKVKRRHRLDRARPAEMVRVGAVNVLTGPP